MAKIEKAVFDARPFIHLAQTDALRVLKLFDCILIPPEVYREVASREAPGSMEIKGLKNVLVKNLDPKYKDVSKVISLGYSLDAGESECIALAKQEQIRLFITDDMDARTVGKSLGLAVHGTVGIVLRAARESVINGNEAAKVIANLKNESSLFITSDIVNYILRKLKVRQKPF